MTLILAVTNSICH